MHDQSIFGIKYTLVLIVNSSEPAMKIILLKLLYKICEHIHVTISVYLTKNML